MISHIIPFNLNNGTDRILKFILTPLIFLKMENKKNKISQIYADLLITRKLIVYVSPATLKVIGAFSYASR